MSEKVRIKRQAKAALTADNALREKAGKAGQKIPGTTMTLDSYQNFQQSLGIGTDNSLTSSSWGFNPVTRIRTLLEWMHRGDWICGAAIDIIAEDMTRAGVTITGELKPDQIDKINERATTLAVWDKICDVIKWSRLYGGCVAVMLIDGQKMDTPLRIETVGKDQFKGLLVLDRWQVDPSLSDLVTDLGPSIGLPKYYTVLDSAPALPGTRIHFSRCLRLEGIRLPYWQRMMENLWGISVLERLYDRLIYANSATAGAAQLVFKAFIRCYKIDNLREIISAGGPALQGLVAQLQFMRATQGNEGITLIDMKDEFSAQTSSAFSGIKDILMAIFEQVAGALEMPLVRLLGQSPGGLNSVGDSELVTYYDGIKQKQVRDLLTFATLLYRITAQSLGIKVPDGFGLEFNPLWQMKDTDLADISTKITTTVTQASDSGLVSPRTALKELKQSSKKTGIWTNITDDEIENAEELPVPPIDPNEGGDESGMGEGDDEGEHDITSELSGSKQSIYNRKKDKIKGVSTSDRALDIVEELKFQGMPIAIENPVGSIRSGRHQDGSPWLVTFKHPYGFIKETMGTDGDSIDCFIGPNLHAKKIFVVHQKNAGGGFDEDKCMLGFDSAEDAKKAYFANYDRPELFFGTMDAYTIPEFKKRIFVPAPGLSK